MHTILDAFSATPTGPDLFEYWQQELQLRHRLGDSVNGPAVRIGDQAQFDFLRRGLFYSPQRDVFFTILLSNMSDPAVVTLVLEAAPFVTAPYLDYVRAQIAKKPLPASSLGFLINIFKDQYRPQYERLIQTMDSQQCGYLLARTGNRQLRQMLKARLVEFKGDAPPGPRALAGGDQPALAWPTRHGDKIELLAAAATLLQGLEGNGSAPLPGELEPETVLDGAELLFRAGLLPDCMALLSRMVLDRDLERHFAVVSATNPLYRRVQRLLHRVVPIYGLLLAPLDPRRRVLEHYRNLFPGFSPEPVSLLYLDLYSLVLAALQGSRQYASFEIVQKSTKIRELVADDHLAGGLVAWGRTGTFDQSEIADILAAKMMQQPHQTLAGLEILRYLQMQGTLVLDKPNATRILSMYLQLYYWLPHTAFINSQLVKQIGVQADAEVRGEAESILAAQQRAHQFDPTTPPLNQGPLTAGDQLILDKMIHLSQSMGVF